MTIRGYTIVMKYADVSMIRYEYSRMALVVVYSYIYMISSLYNMHTTQYLNSALYSDQRYYQIIALMHASDIRLVVD